MRRQSRVAPSGIKFWDLGFCRHERQLFLLNCARAFFFFFFGSPHLAVCRQLAGWFSKSSPGRTGSESVLAFCSRLRSIPSSSVPTNPSQALKNRPHYEEAKCIHLARPGASASLTMVGLSPSRSMSHWPCNGAYQKTQPLIHYSASAC